MEKPVEKTSLSFHSYRSVRQTIVHQIFKHLKHIYEPVGGCWLDLKRTQPLCCTVAESYI